MIGIKECMRKERLIQVTKVGRVGCGCADDTVWAHNDGPDVHLTGVPGTGEKTW